MPGPIGVVLRRGHAVEPGAVELTDAAGVDRAAAARAGVRMAIARRAASFLPVGMNAGGEAYQRGQYYVEEGSHRDNLRVTPLDLRSKPQRTRIPQKNHGGRIGFA